MKTTVYLMRHGRVGGGGPRHFHGQIDVMPDDLGRRQGEELAARLSREKITAVYHTGLERTRRLAGQVGEPHALTPKIEAGLMEISFGEWEGLSESEVRTKWPGMLEARARDYLGFRPPGGESISEMFQRVVSAFEELVARHPGEAIAVAGHANVNRALLSNAVGGGPELVWRFSQFYGCVNRIDHLPDQGFFLVYANLLNTAACLAPTQSKLKVYLDDERIAPEGWQQARWPGEVIALLETGLVSHISLDHDLGDDERGTGYDVILWIEEAVATSNFYPPKISVHSANSSARKKMEAGVRSIERFFRQP